MNGLNHASVIKNIYKFLQCHQAKFEFLIKLKNGEAFGRNIVWVQNEANEMWLTIEAIYFRYLIVLLFQGLINMRVPIFSKDRDLL